MFEGMKIADSSLKKYANSRVVVGIALPDWGSYANITASGAVNLRESKGLYVMNITSLNVEKVAESLQLVPSHKFFGESTPPILFGEVVNMMGKTELSVPYSLSKLPYTFSDFKDFRAGVDRGSANHLLFVLAIYEVETAKGEKPTKLVSVLNYNNGSVLLLPEDALIKEVKTSVMSLINAKIVTRDRLPHLVGINHSLPVLEVVKETNSVVKENVDSKNDDLKLKKLNHDKYRHRVLSKYIRQYLHGNLTPYKFLTKSRKNKMFAKEINVLFEEVFKPLYPEKVALIQNDYSHVNMGLVLEYFIVTFLADKKGYKSKYPIDKPVNTADFRLYRENIASSKWGFEDKLRNEQVLKIYLSHVKDMRHFANIFAESGVGKEVARFLELKNSLYEVKANHKYRLSENDIEGVDSKPLRTMLMALVPKNYKLTVEDRTYTVGGLGFSDKNVGFNLMGYTLTESDVRNKVETPHKVYFATKESKVLRYIFNGNNVMGELKDITFNGEPLYAPDIKSFGSYYIVKTLADYYAKHKTITDLGKLKLIHLLALGDNDLFEQVSRQVDFYLNPNMVYLLEEYLTEYVATLHHEERESLLSGGFFAPYVEYTVNRGFDIPKDDYLSGYSEYTKRDAFLVMADNIKSLTEGLISTEGTLLTYDF